MGLHLVVGQVLLIWFWLTGPVLWGGLSDYPLWGALAAGAMVVIRSLVAWRMWAGRGVGASEGVLLTTGDVFPLRWMRLHHLLGMIHAVLAVLLTGLVAVTGFVPGLWVSYFTYLLVRVMFGLRDASGRAAMDAVVAALNGDGSGVLGNATAQRNPHLLAWGHLIQGDVERAEAALEALDPEGPLAPGCEVKALLELRHGRAALLHRILGVDPGDHLMARYRRASLLLHRDLVQGTRASLQEVAAVEARTPRLYQLPLQALRRRVEGDPAPFPPEVAWMERVYPWLGSPQPELLAPIDTRAIVENLFAPPADDTPPSRPKAGPATVALFPVEWMPVVPASRGDRFLLALVLLFLFAALLTLLSPGHLPALVTLLLPLGLIAAERWVYARRGVPLVTADGVPTGRYLHPDRVGTFTLLRTLRMPALLLIIVIFCVMLGRELGGGIDALLGPLGLLGLALVSSPLIWTRTHPLRWAFGGSTPPTVVDPLLDGHAFVGLGYFLRGQPALADAAWAHSAHPAVGSLRELLRASRLDPEALEIRAETPLCWAWRVAMAKALAARRRGRPELLDADRDALLARFDRVRDPASDLLRALLQGREHPALAALDAYDTAEGASKSG